MFDKYLNPDGTIKEEFKGTSAEKVIPDLYALHKKEGLEAKADAEIKATGSISAETAQEINGLMCSGNFMAITDFRKNAEDVTLNQEALAALDNDQAEVVNKPGDLDSLFPS